MHKITSHHDRGFVQIGVIETTDHAVELKNC